MNGSLLLPLPPSCALLSPSPPSYVKTPLDYHSLKLPNSLEYERGRQERGRGEESEKDERSEESGEERRGGGEEGSEEESASVKGHKEVLLYVIVTGT